MEAPVVTPPSFDLGSESVKKILRDTAATQYATARPAEAEPAKSPPSAEKAFQYIAPEKPPAKPVAKLNLPPMPAALESNGFLSALIETLIDEALDSDYDDPVEANTVSWLTCQAAIDLKRETLGQGSCNR